jgi:hypothetical protein
MADHEVIEAERSLLYRQIIEKKRKTLGGSSISKTPDKQTKTLGQTFATTAEGHHVNLKFTAADQEISVISKASSRMEHILEKTPESPRRQEGQRREGDGARRDLAELVAEDDTPRLRSLRLTPTALPPDDLHDSLARLTRPPSTALSRKPKSSLLPEGGKRAKLRDFDFARLDKSRQSASARGSQLKVRRQASKSPASRGVFTVRDRLHNQLAFLLKTYGEHGDKASVSYKGLGKVLCGLGVFKHFAAADMDINEFTINKVKLHPVKAKEEARLHDELWHFLRFYCYEDTELVPAALVHGLLKVFMTHDADQHGIKELKAAADDYLLDIGWQPDQIEEFNGYVEEETEAAKRLPLFKIFLKFDQLKQQKGEPQSLTRVAFDSHRDEGHEHNKQLERLKKALLVKDKPLARSTLLFEGYEFTFLPDHAPKSSRSAKTGDFEDIIQKKSFGELLRETEAEHFKVAFNAPMDRAALAERQASERDHEDKENFNYNLVVSLDSVPKRDDPAGPKGIFSTS